MFDTFAGLPVHALVVHAVVVLGPLTALTLVVYAVLPRCRVALRWPLLAAAVVSAGAGQVAARSGEELRDRLSGAAEPVRSRIAEHVEAGELAAVSLLVLLGATVLVLLIAPARRSSDAGRARAVAAVVLAVGAAGFAGYAVVDAGHSGSTAVWKQIVDNTDSTAP